MVRLPKSIESIKIFVRLRNGDEYGPFDTTDKPMGDRERVVAFWMENSIRVIPLEDVEYFEYIFDE